MLEYMSNLISSHRAKRQFSKRYNKIVSDFNTSVCASITYSSTLHCLKLYKYSLSRSDADRHDEVLIVGKDPFAYNYISNFAEYITGEQLEDMARYAIREHEAFKKFNEEYLKDIADKEADKEEDNEDLNKEKETHIEKKEEWVRRVLRDGDGEVIEDEELSKTTTTKKTTE